MASFHALELPLINLKGYNTLYGTHLLAGIADEVLHPEVEVGGGGVAVAALALQLLHVGLVVAALLLVHRHPDVNQLFGT
jgi:hypothetical protein